MHSLFSLSWNVSPWFWVRKIGMVWSPTPRYCENKERNCESCDRSQQHLLATIFCENLRLERVKSGTKKPVSGVFSCVGTITILAGICKGNVLRAAKNKDFKNFFEARSTLRF